jgi:hypothetical protein
MCIGESRSLRLSPPCYEINAGLQEIAFHVYCDNAWLEREQLSVDLICIGGLYARFILHVFT